MRTKATQKQMTELVSTVESLHKMGRTPERALEFISGEYPFYFAGTYSDAIKIGFNGAYGMDKMEFDRYVYPAYTAPVYDYSASNEDILDQLFAD